MPLTLPYQQSPGGELRLVPLGGCNEAPQPSAGIVQQCQWRPGGESYFHSHPAIMSHLSTSLLGWYHRRLSIESGLSQSPCPVVTKTVPPQWWWKPHGESELPTLSHSSKGLNHLGSQWKPSEEPGCLPTPGSNKVAIPFSYQRRVLKSQTKKEGLNKIKRLMT